MEERWKKMKKEWIADQNDDEGEEEALSNKTHKRLTKRKRRKRRKSRTRKDKEDNVVTTKVGAFPLRRKHSAFIFNEYTRFSGHLTSGLLPSFLPPLPTRFMRMLQLIPPLPLKHGEFNELSGHKNIVSAHVRNGANNTGQSFWPTWFSYYSLTIFCETRGYSRMSTLWLLLRQFAGGEFLANLL